MNRIDYYRLMKKKKNMLLITVIAMLLLLVIVCILSVCMISKKNTQIKENEERIVFLENELGRLTDEKAALEQTQVVEEASEQTEVSDLTEETEDLQEETDLRTQAEEKAYSFLQGPLSWKRRLTWSGVWGKTYYDGDSFGGYGCGLCCLANIYSTLTDYEATPVNLYAYAKKVTDYGGGGPIDWVYMYQVLQKLGMEAKLMKKPDSYREFREDIENCLNAVVLVCSYDSTCYWENTDGHYVTILGYDPETEEIFLGDSGDPTHNRQWVSLDKIYQSLKTSSRWQYLCVNSYDDQSCSWKHEYAGGRWVRP